jgi:tRNA A37 threonylcarbamoyladenosine dehydratase
MGIAIVVPVEKILEAINQPLLAEYRKRSEFREREIATGTHAIYSEEAESIVSDENIKNEQFSQEQTNQTSDSEAPTASE